MVCLRDIRTTIRRIWLILIETGSQRRTAIPNLSLQQLYDTELKVILKHLSQRVDETVDAS